MAQDKIDPEKIVEQNDRPTQEDAERNARAFADALRSMESILSPSFGLHAGGVMSKGEFGPQGNDAPEQPDTQVNTGQPDENTAEAIEAMSQPIDVWSGRDSESIGREPFEFATARQQDRPPVAEQPRFEQPVRNEADAGEPPPPPPTETVNFPEPPVPQQPPPQPASAVMAASEKPTVPQSLEKPSDAKVPRVESAPSPAKEARKSSGGPEFLRRLAMPERPIMDPPESGTKEQNAHEWLNDHGRAFPNETDPGAKPRDGKFPHENRRAMDFAAVEVVDALDEYGMRQIELAERMASVLRMLGRSLERITRSLDSEGRDYE